MRSEVIVTLADRELHIDLDEVQPMTQDAARAWLDEQFLRLGCEPLRASGKVLMADKVLCIARAAGATLLADAQWARAYGRAASAALAKPVIHVNVPQVAVTC